MSSPKREKKKKSVPNSLPNETHPKPYIPPHTRRPSPIDWSQTAALGTRRFSLRHILVGLGVVPAVCLEVAPLAKPIAGVSGGLVGWVKALVTHEAVAELVAAEPMRNKVYVGGSKHHPIRRGWTKRHPVQGGGSEQHGPRTLALLGVSFLLLFLVKFLVCFLFCVQSHAFPDIG